MSPDTSHKADNMSTTRSMIVILNQNGRTISEEDTDENRSKPHRDKTGVFSKVVALSLISKILVLA